MRSPKTRVVRWEAGVKFLGYRLQGGKVGHSAKSVQRLPEKVRSLSARHDTRPWADVISRGMSVVFGR